MKPEQPHHQAGSPSKSIFSAPKTNLYVSTAYTAGVPGIEQSWPHKSGIHSKALTVRAATRQGEAEAEPSRGMCSPKGCGQDPLNLPGAGEAFPLHLGPPSGAASRHWLSHLKEACGEKEPPGKFKPAAKNPWLPFPPGG